MRILLIISFLTFFSCKKSTIETHVVLQNEVINKAYLHQINEPEKALLSWYLYAYGNACDTSTKAKCTILNELNIHDECDADHLKMMLQWMSNDMMASYKLNKCPNIAAKSAIQNAFKKIILTRIKDTLIIDFNIQGMNNSQEKSWNINKIDKYLITSRNFVKLN